MEVMSPFKVVHRIAMLLKLEFNVVSTVVPALTNIALPCFSWGHSITRSFLGYAVGSGWDHGGFPEYTGCHSLVPCGCWQKDLLLWMIVPQYFQIMPAMPALEKASCLFAYCVLQSDV